LGEELFRVGGEEFAIVIGIGRTGGVRVAERVRAAVADERRCEHLPTLSAGVAAFPEDGLTKEELVERADVALYAAKNAGRNNVASADGIA